MTTGEFNHAVDLHADRLFRFVLKNIRDVHFAEDIVQDSYEKLWKNVEKVSPEKSRAYLFSIAYHTMIDRIRKEKRLIPGGLYPPDRRESAEQYSDVGEWLDKAVERLPEIQRIVLTLRDFENYSYQEIGEITGLNESQVKVYIYRARIFIRNFIGKIDVLV